ncbi:hypothetical protein BKA81DRAFT_377263 [Phyllosticta paracitricarpa]
MYDSSRSEAATVVFRTAAGPHTPPLARSRKATSQTSPTPHSHFPTLASVGPSARMSAITTHHRPDYRMIQAAQRSSDRQAEHLVWCTPRSEEERERVSPPTGTSEVMVRQPSYTEIRLPLITRMPPVPIGTPPATWRSLGVTHAWSRIGAASRAEEEDVAREYGGGCDE